MNTDAMPIEEARRLALAAQGFDRRRPARVSERHLAAAIHRMGLLQIDFVNVLTPSHYLVPFSRLGPYDRTRLDRVVYGSREFTEAWAHEASIVPMSTWPLLRYRRETHIARPWGFDEIMAQHHEVRGHGHRGNPAARPACGSRPARPVTHRTPPAGVVVRERAEGRARGVFWAWPARRDRAARQLLPRLRSRRAGHSRRAPRPRRRSSRCAARAAAGGGARVRGSDRGRPGGLLPHDGRGGEAAYRGACRGRPDPRRPCRRVARGRLCPPGGTRAAAHRHAGPALALRPADLVPAPYGTTVRFRLSFRDIRSQSQAQVGELRVAVRVRRPAGRPCRREDGLRRRAPAGPGGVSRSVGRCRGGEPRRSRSSSGRWRRGSDSTPCAWDDGATWPRCWQRRREVSRG